MAILKVIEEPNPLLHRISRPIKTINADIRKTLDDMLETMYDYNGIGLAAIQVGLLKRMLVIDLGDPSEADTWQGVPLKMINPQILWSSEVHNTFTEGCLSVPQHYVDKSRPSEVKVRYQDEQGTFHELFARGLLAICLQHEIDHLNGITLLNGPVVLSPKELLFLS
ncbi:MAG: peptide deformylase [Holosporales bacterium]|jgi:peptide deformylase